METDDTAPVANPEEIDIDDDEDEDDNEEGTYSPLLIKYTLTGQPCAIFSVYYKF